MNYEVVFEVSKNAFGISMFALPGIFLIIVSIILYKFPKLPQQLSQKELSEQVIRYIALSLLGFAGLWTVAVLGGTYLSNRSARKSYESGNFKVVTGVVKNFIPMPAGGHAMESFTVKGVKFRYSDYRVTPGFNNAASKGGPIKEGLPVRISHTGNLILKLEVAKHNIK